MSQKKKKWERWRHKESKCIECSFLFINSFNTFREFGRWISCQNISFLFLLLLTENKIHTNQPCCIGCLLYINITITNCIDEDTKTRHQRIIELRKSKRLNHGLNSILWRWWCWEWRYIILMFRITVDCMCHNKQVRVNEMAMRYNVTLLNRWNRFVDGKSVGKVGVGGWLKGTIATHLSLNVIMH